MLVVYEVYLQPGTDPAGLFSEETLRETHAQVMTVQEAAAVGFSGIKPDAKGREMRLVAVSERDARWIERSLDSHPGVASFRRSDL